MRALTLFDDPQEIITWGDYATTLSHNETSLIKSIMQLHNDGKPFDVDPCYSIGRFWTGLPQPIRKFDINPQKPGVEQASADNLPIESESVESVMYDPPFLVGMGVPGKIKERFSRFPTMRDLWSFYRASIAEFYRILIDDGLLVVKCQDCVSGSTQFLSHVEIINMAEATGFYCKDLFVLGNNQVLWSPNMVKQQHARKTHSYFLVFRKNRKMRDRIQKVREALND